MRTRACAIIPFLFIAITVQNACAGDENTHETIGIRFGYAATGNRLDDSFGAGFVAALHFTEHLNSATGIDFNFGSIYMGRTARQDITFERFMTNDEMRMNIVFITVSPLARLKFYSDYALYGSAGIGLYAVTLVREMGFFWGSNTQYHPGVTAAIGIGRSLTDSWHLDANLALHQFWTDDAPDDWIAVYSEGDQDPFFYQITVGASLDIR